MNRALGVGELAFEEHVVIQEVARDAAGEEMIKIQRVVITVRFHPPQLTIEGDVIEVVLALDTRPADLLIVRGIGSADAAEHPDETHGRIPKAQMPAETMNAGGFVIVGVHIVAFGERIELNREIVEEWNADCTGSTPQRVPVVIKLVIGVTDLGQPDIDPEIARQEQPHGSGTVIRLPLRLRATKTTQDRTTTAESVSYGSPANQLYWGKYTRSNYLGPLNGTKFLRLL